MRFQGACLDSPSAFRPPQGERLKRLQQDHARSTLVAPAERPPLQFDDFHLLGSLGCGGSAAVARRCAPPAGTFDAMRRGQKTRPSSTGRAATTKVQRVREQQMVV